MSGLEIVGGISAIIGIITAAIKIYDSARKDLKLSETFQTVRRRLPVILDTLQTCQQHLEPIKDTLLVDVCEALEKIIDACDEKAAQLRRIFEKVVPGEGEGWQKRYVKVMRGLGKGNKVEELTLAIATDVQLIVNHQAVRSATPAQEAELKTIIEEMKCIRSSATEDETLGMTFDSGGGPQTNNINTGSGQQINNNAPVTTQNFNSVIKPRADFSYRKPMGLCLGQAPHIDPTLFVGRKSEIDEMGEAFKSGDQTQKTRRLVLGGMGGIGKTQLAISYAHRNFQEYSSVFWLNATTEATLKDSLSKMAELIFDVPASELQEGEVVLTRTHQWLSDSKNVEWLLIFDNYDNPNEFKIDTYFPSVSHGSIIITTRRPDLVAGRKMVLRPLQNAEESLEILQRRSQRENITSDPYAERLAERLAGLPLALATAGAFLYRSSFTFERYLQEYERRWNIDPKRPVRLEEYQDRTLHTTWTISFIRLECDDVEAAKLLRLLAYFDNHSIWYDLVRAGLHSESPSWLQEVMADETSFDGAMGKLTNYCFVEVQAGQSSWSMHTCVHDWTLAFLNKDIDQQLYWHAFDCVAASIIDQDLDSLGHLVYAPVSTHAARLARDHFCETILKQIVPTRLHRVERIAWLLKQQDRLVAAEQMFLRALTVEEMALGADHVSTLLTVHNLGSLYRAQGNLAEAEKMYCRALAGREAALGLDHMSTLATVNSLGNLYSAQGQLAEAEKMYLRALTGKEMALGANHMSTLSTVNNLGSLYKAQGHLAEAERMYCRALTGREATLGADHKLTLSTVHNFGDLYRKQGRLKEAEKMYLRALAGKEATLGADHSSTLITVNNLGNIYKKQGQVEEAEKMYRRASLGLQKSLGQEHQTTIGVTKNLARLDLRTE